MEGMQYLIDGRTRIGVISWSLLAGTRYQNARRSPPVFPSVWVESCRRDLLDHIIAVNERHLKRLLSEYVRYYHDDRTHLGLEKGTPNCRNRSNAPVASCLVNDSA